MNVSAILKTALVFVAVGGLTGWETWKQTSGAPIEVQAHSAYYKCVEDAKLKQWQKDPVGGTGKQYQAQVKKIEADCHAQNKFETALSYGK
jgi:hypothetical protein